METYDEYMTAIFPDELLKGLLAHGLFAEKIPNFLTSIPFYNYYIAQGKPEYENNGCDYIRYYSMRNVNIPRLLAIPNPFAYANLCNCLSKNWEEEIQLHLGIQTENQTHKISRIHIRKMKGSDCLFEMNYKNIDKDGTPEQSLIIKSKFIVEADISNCFPSIYSHSIPWGLVGKNKARNTRYDKTAWYNNLDFYIRNTKNQETNGLLIGPHTSNILSELILTVIDKCLYDKGFRYVRYIDDYICYTETYEKAEQFLLDLSSALKEFELTVNTKKTKIIPLPQPLNVDWKNRLATIVIEKEGEDEKPFFRKKQLEAFIDMVIELTTENNNAAILNYAIKMVVNTQLGVAAKRYYINIIHYLLLNYPYLVHIMDDYVFTPFEIDKEKIREIADNLFEVGITKRTYEACNYAVYWALKHDFELRNSDATTKSLNSNDCIFMLLSYLYAKKSKDNAALEQHNAKAKELKDTDIDRYWLYVYEVLSKDDLSIDFKAIKNQNITFIKEEFKYQ
jgi:hypothetical protein